MIILSLNIIYYFHIWIMIFYLFGFLIPYKTFPKIYNFHKIFVVWILIIQYCLDFRCPLTILENYLIESINPDQIIEWQFAVSIINKYMNLWIIDQQLNYFLIVCGVLSIVFLFLKNRIKIKKKFLLLMISKK